METDGQTQLFRPRLLHKGRLTGVFRHHISCVFADIRRNYAITTHVIDIYRNFNHASHKQHVFSSSNAYQRLHTIQPVTNVKKRKSANDVDSC